MTRRPDFDELIGTDVPDQERKRLRHAHDLLVQAGPPPELSPELESVPWPEDALGPIWGKRRKEQKSWMRRPVVLAAALATAIVIGFVLGSARADGDSFNVRQTLKMHGTNLEPGALATLELGRANRAGNWPMRLHVTGLPKLEKGGYYDLYLTKGGKPLVSCGTFNADRSTEVRWTAAYNLERFDKNGWVIVRKTPGHFEPDQVVVKADAA